MWIPPSKGTQEVHFYIQVLSVSNGYIKCNYDWYWYLSHTALLSYKPPNQPKPHWVHTGFAHSPTECLKQPINVSLSSVAAFHRSVHHLSAKCKVLNGRKRTFYHVWGLPDPPSNTEKTQFEGCFQSHLRLICRLRPKKGHFQNQSQGSASRAV